MAYHLSGVVAVLRAGVRGSSAFLDSGVNRRFVTFKMQRLKTEHCRCVAAARNWDFVSDSSFDLNPNPGCLHWEAGGRRFRIRVSVIY